VIEVKFSKTKGRKTKTSKKGEKSKKQTNNIPKPFTTSLFQKGSRQRSHQGWKGALRCFAGGLGPWTRALQLKFGGLSQKSLKFQVMQ
jgi:hypothetical protein